MAALNWRAWAPAVSVKLFDFVIEKVRQMPPDGLNLWR
jgi:hypothetical protein